MLWTEPPLLKATLWKPLVPTTFTNDDERAREAMHEFYAREDGWHKERLFGPDLVITKWRELASRVNRGIFGCDTVGRALYQEQLLTKMAY